MSLGIKKWGRPLAIWFSIAGLVGVLPAFTANQLTQSYIDVLNPNEFSIFLVSFEENGIPITILNLL